MWNPGHPRLHQQTGRNEIRDTHELANEIRDTHELTNEIRDTYELNKNRIRFAKSDT